MSVLYSYVDSYKIYLYSSKKMSTTSSERIASITLHNPDGGILATANFYPDGCELPPASQQGTSWDIAFNASQFYSIMDMLRNEKPIRIYCASDHGLLTTSAHEPIGEEET
jgi:hypothetical protein